MGILFLLFFLGRHAPLAALYLVQAVTCLGLAAAMLHGEHPAMTCTLHIVLASSYVTVSVAHAPAMIRWAWIGRRGAEDHYQRD